MLSADDLYKIKTLFNLDINETQTLNNINSIENILLSLPDEPEQEPEAEPELEPSIIGKLIDGYIAGAHGELLDANNPTIPIETFITDAFGRYEIMTQIDKLPEFYKIKFKPGGTDISTGKTITTTLSNISTKEKAIESDNSILNITPITTIISKVIEKNDSQIDTDIIESSVAIIATVFGIDEHEIEEDFIIEENSNIIKVVTQLETTLQTLKTAINNDNVDEDIISNSIVNTIVSTDTTYISIDLTNIEDIISIVEQIETDIDIDIADNVKKNTSDLLNVINTNIQNISIDETKSFEEIFTQSAQLSVATENILTSDTAPDFTSEAIDLINTVLDINVESIKVEIDKIYPPEPEPEIEPESKSEEDKYPPFEGPPIIEDKYPPFEGPPIIEEDKYPPFTGPPIIEDKYPPFTGPPIID